jgi:hypothetical protein
MPANKPEVADGVMLVPEAAAAVVAVTLKSSDEATASESVTCTPDNVIDPSGF